MRVLKTIIGWIFCLAIICAILLSGYKLESKLDEYRTAKTKYTETSQQVRNGRDVDFDKLLERNEDVKAWIYLPDSQIDYPVVQAEDDDFYLHRDIDKNYLYDGTIFIEAGNEHPFEDFNTVIYGHHMFSGAMFCGLDKFKEKDYWKDHGLFQIETPDGSYDLKVIAYCNEPSDSDLYTTFFDDSYDYTEPGEEDDEESEVMTKEDFLDFVQEKAVILGDDDFDTNSHYVTLSTCAYNYDEARTQVIGVLQDPKIETVKETKMINKYTKINHWLLLQIAIGIIMAVSVIFLLVGQIKSTKRPRYQSKH